jgi:hypothetical protein
VALPSGVNSLTTGSKSMAPSFWSRVARWARPVRVQNAQPSGSVTGKYQQLLPAFRLYSEDSRIVEDRPATTTLLFCAVSGGQVHREMGRSTERWCIFLPLTST